jgi:plastocyanin
MKPIRLSQIICTAAISLILSSMNAFAETREFKVDAVEINKTKYWLPAHFKIKKNDLKFKVPAEAGDFTVKKGDTVIFRLVSKIGGANNIHGFAIDEYKIEALVDDKGLVNSKEKEIKFVADRPGTFPIRCQLHPAHVGGHLIVQE